MLRFKFKKLYRDLEIRVKEEGKKNSSWIMGYCQGLGSRKLTGYQFASLVDLLLVHPEAPTDFPVPVHPDAELPSLVQEGVVAAPKLTFGQGKA